MNSDHNQQENNTEKKRRKGVGKLRRTAETIIILCLAVIMVISGWNIISKYREYRVNRELYDSIAELAMPEGLDTDTGFDGEIDFDALSKVNSDIVAWIYYEDTSINYPIVQGKDNDYYLHITFEGSWAIAGTLFVEAVTEEPFKQFNTIVYGHHMQDGSMFGDFQKLKDPDYCKEHPQLELITPEGKYHLKICAFLNQPSDSFVYTTNMHNPDDQQKYIDSIDSLAVYTTLEKMEPGDRLVVLSTCAYEYQDARYMVICKMIPW